MKKPIPFEFVIEALYEKNPVVKPMFGAFGVYVNDGKMAFILRDRDSYTDDNGVWLCTQAEHHESLQKIFPHMRPVALFGDGPHNTTILPVDAPDFESSVNLAIELVLKNDPRIGRYPKAKKPKKVKTAVAKKPTKKIVKKKTKKKS